MVNFNEHIGKEELTTTLRRIKLLTRQHLLRLAAPLMKFNTADFRNLVLALYSLHCCSHKRVKFTAVAVVETPSGTACETSRKWHFYLRYVVSGLHRFHYLHIRKEVSVYYLWFFRNKNFIENFLEAGHAFVKLELTVDSEQFQIEVAFTIRLNLQLDMLIGKNLTDHIVCFGS